ncbi:hypothetical protein GMOD_00002520 [Pyrenophora seminiperda CCB06]|uniref:Uncharacterized protein n=1 Tax=Pyrenophora seminiperda CCB06 TaxID=1302712 RepID=A0A3M7M2S5_9PLEO|nr:hypothetical protein GMOD_00002520 [Pyrenophora seminiperda CCB06]
MNRVILLYSNTNYSPASFHCNRINQASLIMLFTSALFMAALAVLPSAQAAPKKHEITPNNYVELDCYVANVKVKDEVIDKDPSLKYDWQLTQQTCVNNYKGLAIYDNAKGRCISLSSDGLGLNNWNANCKRQALNGWYDVDPATGNLDVISRYHSDQGEGRGYAWQG